MLNTAMLQDALRHDGTSTAGMGAEARLVEHLDFDDEEANLPSSDRPSLKSEMGNHRSKQKAK